LKKEPLLNIDRWLSRFGVLLFGFIVGGPFGIDWFSRFRILGGLSCMNSLLNAFLGTLVFVLIFLTLRKLVRFLIGHIIRPYNALPSYIRYDTIISALFFLALFGTFDIHFDYVSASVLVLIFFFLHFAYILLILNGGQRRELASWIGWLPFLFVISGFAALIYQIVWQRALFGAFGVNIESVTIIVSVFMLGLGIGSLLGGILTSKYDSALPQLFLLCEVIIGCFGLVSLPLIKAVASLAVKSSLLMTIFTVYGVLCIPTIFMGATLPILVTYLHKCYKNVGKSVGLLYALNTLGSALACFVTVDILFSFGLQMSVLFAAFCNFSVGFLAYRYTQILVSRGSQFDPLAPSRNEG
jgi:hypothetical protein